VAKSKEIADSLAKDNGDPIGSTPEEFREFLTQEVARWQKTAQRAGIQLDE
jgi:tripartite-type tricarboxylate transporter receptor subunit TctC